MAARAQPPVTITVDGASVRVAPRVTVAAALRVAREYRGGSAMSDALTAGIAAAVRASECGRDVVLLHRDPAPGGQIWRRRVGTAPPRDGRVWLTRLERSRVRVIGRTSVVDVHAAGDAFEVIGDRDAAPRRLIASHVVLPIAVLASDTAIGVVSSPSSVTS